VKRLSLRRRLLLLLVGSLVLVWGAMLVVGYDEAREEVHELADARLQQGARTLLVLDLKRLARLAGANAIREADPGNGADRGDGAQPLEFQVWGGTGEPLLASSGAPPAAHRPEEGYATRTIAGRDWRSYSVYDGRHAYQVTVLEPIDIREHPIRDMAEHMGQVLVWALPLLAMLVWLSVRHGLKPLAQLSDAVSARDAGNLEPIRPQRVAAEVESLISALNDLLARLARSLDRERAFTADAAHELRTPLAAIKVQAEVALGAEDEATRRHAIGQVIEGVNRTTHLAEQLLLLARLEHADMNSRQAVELGRLAAERIAQRAGDATARSIDVELAAEPGCVLAGDPATLAILIDNLLDNAIKYGNAGGHVAVTLRREARGLLLMVADDGAGVAEADRAHLRNRFFRAEGNASPGSGLGLSIVEKIAAAHGGAVGIGAGLAGHGLGVTVRFTFEGPS
jgi:two-component system sensor histidine kinase QseC